MVFFDGSDEEMFLEFLRLNARHGLGLTLPERKNAARVVMSKWAEFSDRRIGELCGLSPHTIASIRHASLDSSIAARQSTAPDIRTGRDGKNRPVNAAPLHQRIVEELQHTPDRSLRSVAEVVGASPETVRKVQKDLRNCGSVASIQTTAVPAPVKLEVRHDANENWWTHDDSLRSADDGLHLLEWLDKSNIADADWQKRINSVPLSRIYQVAEEARRRSMSWGRFARAVEDRGGTKSRISAERVETR